MLVVGKKISAKTLQFCLWDKLQTATRNPLARVNFDRKIISSKGREKDVLRYRRIRKEQMIKAKV